MRIRVLISNEDDVRDLIWLEHTGKDIYTGLTGSSTKTTYHASGQIHDRTQGERAVFGKVTSEPLDELADLVELQTLFFRNEDAWHQGLSPIAKYQGKKYDAAMYLDSRSVEKGTVLGIRIGVVQSHSLNRLTDFITEIERKPWVVRQVLFSTEVKPWVYVLLTTHHPEMKAPDKNASDDADGQEENVLSFIPEPGFAFAGRGLTKQSPERGLWTILSARAEFGPGPKHLSKKKR